jgi:hypothetical protein
MKKPMPSESIDYERVIADLEAKRNAFNLSVDSAIQGIRHVLAAIGALPAAQQITGTHVSSTATVNPPSLTPDAFFGLGIAEAAVRYLQIVKRQQMTREIAEALESANYHHTSQNFINTVNTALSRRLKDEGDVIKIGKKWALAEWYPGRRTRAIHLRSDEERAAGDTETGSETED